MELTKQQVNTWLSQHPAIKVTAFLAECGLGRNYLNQLTLDVIPPETAQKLLLVMKKYGYKPENL